MAYLLSRSRAIAQQAPANNWRWIARMPSIPGAPAATQVVAESIEFQFRSIAATPRFGGAMQRKFPTVTDVAAVNMSFYETEGYIATTYLDRWQKMIVDDQGVFGMPREYKKNIVLELYSITESKLYTGMLIDVWPSQVGGFSLNYNDSGRIVVSCSFEVDRVGSGRGSGSSILSMLMSTGMNVLTSGVAALTDAFGNAVASTVSDIQDASIDVVNDAVDTFFA